MSGREAPSSRTERTPSRMAARRPCRRPTGCVAGRAHHAALHDRLDARARLHGVHVGRKHDRAARRAGQVRDEVSRVRSRLRSRPVEAHLEPQGAQLVGATARHRRFAARGAFDADEFAEQVEQTVRVHEAPSNRVRRKPAATRGAEAQTSLRLDARGSAQRSAPRRLRRSALPVAALAHRLSGMAMRKRRAPL